MRFKAILISVSVLILMLVLHIVSRSHVNLYRTDYTYRLHAAALPVSPEIINALAGEFKGLFADYLLLEAASFVGSPQAFEASPEDWNAVARLLKQSNFLDPYFRSTYKMAQTTLPWFAKEYDQTLAILERSKQHLPWDWLPGFYIGFDYYFFLKDNLTASKKLMEASRIPGAPIALPTLASRLASRAGQTSVAIQFLIAVYEHTEDEQAKEILKDRILALQGVQLLEYAVDRFRNQFGRMPQSLDELVESGILSALPPNPYNHPYSFKDGKVEF